MADISVSYASKPVSIAGIISPVPAINTTINEGVLCTMTIPSSIQKQPRDTTGVIIPSIVYSNSGDTVQTGPSNTTYWTTG